MTVAERVERLIPMTHYGPDYDRGVASALADHWIFAGNNAAAAEHFLLVAELRAGLLLWDQFVEVDPFKREGAT